MKKNLLSKIFPFLSWGREIDRSSIWHDLIAGLTGAIVVLPQGIAFAIIAGMPPEYGLYTAMVLPIVTALFGSSRHLVTGPATAMCIVIFASISQYAEPGSDDFIRLVFALTLITGVIQFVFGAVRLGGLVNFVSQTVVIGFTAGAALLIATSQVPSALGVDVPKGFNFFETYGYIFTHVGDIQLWVVAVSGSSLLTAILVKKLLPKFPWLLIAMVVGGVVAWAVGGEAVGIEFVAKIQRRLPPFSLPSMNFNEFKQLVPDAFALALLGLISSAAIGRSIATKSKQIIDGNQEFIGQGLANIAGSFLSGFAGAGSFSRSGVNYEAGAKTPMANIFATGILIAIIMVLAPVTSFLPMPAMSGVILLVAFSLIDFGYIKKSFKTSKEEVIILGITFLSTLILELQFAIYIGILFSLVFYLRKTAKPRIVTIAPDPEDPAHRFVNIGKFPQEVCPQLKVIRFDGSTFFGAISHVSKKLNEFRREGPKHMLIVGNGINLIDIEGAELLLREKEEREAMGGKLYFSNFKFRVRRFLKKGGYWEKLGPENIFLSKKDAIKEIYSQLDREKCKECKVKIFFECRGERSFLEGGALPADEKASVDDGEMGDQQEGKNTLPS